MQILQGQRIRNDTDVLSISFDMVDDFDIGLGRENPVPSGEPSNTAGLQLPGQVGPWYSLVVGGGLASINYFDNRSIRIGALTLTLTPNVQFETLYPPAAGADNLREAVVFIRGTTLPRPTMTWSLTGLDPGFAYDVILFGQQQNGNAVNFAAHEINGFTPLVPVVPDAEGDANFLGVIPTAAGAISGTMDFPAGGAFAAWAGMQVQQSTQLPVELTSFQAKTMDRQTVQLNWETLSESDFLGFEIESRSGQEENWQPIAFVAGEGSESESHNYSYSISDLSVGIHHFRLKNMDLDGSFSYSPELQTELGLIGSLELGEVYPNPSRGSSTFTIAVSEVQELRVDLFDLSGRLIKTLFDDRMPASQARRLEIDTGSLPSGMYHILARGETVRSRSFVVTR